MLWLQVLVYKGAGTARQRADGANVLHVAALAGATEAARALLRFGSHGEGPPGAVVPKKGALRKRPYTAHMACPQAVALCLVALGASGMSLVLSTPYLLCSAPTGKPEKEEDDDAPRCVGVNVRRGVEGNTTENTALMCAALGMPKGTAAGVSGWKERKKRPAPPKEDDEDAKAAVLAAKQRKRRGVPELDGSDDENEKTGKRGSGFRLVVHTAHTLALLAADCCSVSPIRPAADCYTCAPRRPGGTIERRGVPRVYGATAVGVGRRLEPDGRARRHIAAPRLRQSGALPALQGHGGGARVYPKWAPAQPFQPSFAGRGCCCCGGPRRDQGREGAAAGARKRGRQQGQSSVAVCACRESVAPTRSNAAA